MELADTATHTQSFNVMGTYVWYHSCITTINYHNTGYRWLAGCRGTISL